MKRIIFGLLALSLFGCSAPRKDARPMDSVVPDRASLPDLGLAPELTNDTWLNVDSPLRLADLHGKVVLLEM
jgi:hypothetical protein